MPTPITLPTWAGHTFSGYYDQLTGGKLYYNFTGGAARAWDKTVGGTLYARWDGPRIGDVDGDGQIDSSDAREILQYSVGLGTLTPEQLICADVNFDGVVDSEDARIILNWLIGL